MAGVFQLTGLEQRPKSIRVQIGLSERGKVLSVIASRRRIISWSINTEK